MAAWIITNAKDNDLAWSNGEGWVTDTFDTFNDFEREMLMLPVGGEWTLVPWWVEPESAQ